MRVDEYNYYSTKTYGHSQGLSCCFRQWRANSHCNLLHGYALKVKITFNCKHLDDRNWVQDFGNLKEVKEMLQNYFDHTTVIAEDDPELFAFRLLNDRKIVDLRVLPGVGCEMFAEFIFSNVRAILAKQQGGNMRVNVCEVEVSEHEGNSAIYRMEQI